MSYIRIKRCFDLVFSLIGLLLLAPLLLFISIVIKIDSVGPILYRQKRIGFHGRLFCLYKFRSMYQGSEKGGVYEKKLDTRVTRVGRIIRKTSLDELPQLLNILKGEMSFIGPRPVLINHPWPLREYSDEQIKRFLVRPGVSGLAQIHGRKNLSWEERMKYDVQYVCHYSFQMDIKIFFITIYKVITMQDNYNQNQTAIKKEKESKLTSKNE